MHTSEIELGCGLIGIGRPWGHQETAVPTEEEALVFLNATLAHSIHYYDTAPAYGLSEARLGSWLTSLSPEQRNELTVATKFGEYWNEDGTTYVDHSYQSLKSSLDTSLELLGKIDVLQLHKTNPDVLRSEDLARAWDYAQEKGISVFGASVSDLESGEIVCEDDRYSLIQVPFNQANNKFAPIIQEATRRGMVVVINRPFNMGEMMSQATPENKQALQQKAFEFIMQEGFRGYILTGTKSPAHLSENVEAFSQALN